MDVLLSKELENFVSEQVKRGNYLSTDEVGYFPMSINLREVNISKKIGYSKRRSW